MLLKTAVPTRVKRGHYFVQIATTSGTAAATISVEGLPGVALADFTTSAAKTFYASLPECWITATLTGDAQIVLSPVALDTR